MTATSAPPAASGAALLRRRRARGWRRGVPVMTVTRAEQGRSVGLAQAVGLAGAYGTTAGALLDGAEGRT
jgi:hypothetical protein